MTNMQTSVFPAGELILSSEQVAPKTVVNADEVSNK